MINYNELFEKSKKLAKESGLTQLELYQRFMFERILERISLSEYNENFILKGGFYLSKLFGLDNRSTMDIDAAIRKTHFSEENIVEMITEIINIDADDSVKFEIKKIETIREEDEYGGLRITINFALENMKDSFHMDIATGDPIYLGPIDYKYESLIGNEVYKVWSYNLETVLAEKIETILSKLETSSRMKDYYDIYLIHKFKFNKINKTKFRGAVKKTFEKRKFHADLIVNLNVVKDSRILRDKWTSYSRKNSYATNLEFDEIIRALEEFIEIIVPVTV